VTTRRYRAASVVDFAWTACRRFVVAERDIVPVDDSRMDDPVAAESRRVKALLDLPAADTVIPSVHVVLLLQPEHADQAERHFEAARVALGLFGTWMGPYPYPRLTIVDPPWDCLGAGGMEYPTLVTAGTVADSPRDSQRPEGVTVHEIGHQWLMNLLANNEAKEAWLDEGVNSYVTALALDVGYRPGSTSAPRQYTEVLGRQFPAVPLYEFPGLAAGWPSALGLPGWARPGDIDSMRLWRDLPPLTWVESYRYRSDPMLPYRRSYLRRAGWDPMVKDGWTYSDRTSYVVNAYPRPALFLNTLRRSLAADLGRDEGERRFLRALREYAREQRFRHPTTEDFLRKFREVTGVDPTAASDQLVRGAATLDYAIESIRADEPPDLAGLDEKGAPVRNEEKPVSDQPDASKRRRTTVRMRCRGEAQVPVTLEVVRDNGTSERRRWEPADQAKSRWRDFEFEGVVVSAHADPDAIYLQDGDLSNNSRTTAQNARPAVKWSVRFVDWIENALLSYGRFF
jgi:hypothetical protein